MARTHTILRSEAPRLIAPAEVLKRANELLVAEMPERMFVTCLYLVLEPRTGRVTFANAGHDLPYVRTAAGVLELRATGMPLGILPDMTYEQYEAVIAPGERLFLSSDGLVEAHDPSGEMYGFPRLREALAGEETGSELIDRLLDGLHAFTGRGWEQEDDITLVVLARASDPASADEAPASGHVAEAAVEPESDRLLDIELPGAAPTERVAAQRVAEAVAPLGLAPDRLERLKTAVSEAAMNAVEYGSADKPEVPIRLVVERVGSELRVHITDRGLGGPIPDTETPDIEAKLAGLQKPRGWGLFLIRHMVDDVTIASGDDGQTVTLTLDLEGDRDGQRST